MSEEKIIVTGVNFYITSDVNDWLVSTFDEDGGEKCEFSKGDAFSFDIIEQPFHCGITGDGTDVRMELFVRSELGVYPEGSCDLGVVLHGGTNEIEVVKSTGRIGGSIEDTARVLLYTGHQVRKYVLAQGALPDFAGIDPEQEGVLVNRSGDALQFERVSGKRRPAMACTTLFGGVEMMRPYFDEIADAWHTSTATRSWT